MTWIVGAAPPIGYAVGISDIRVTFAVGSERDCLQKIHPISDFVALGFAGSVRIGFAMVDALRNHLRDLPEGAAWFPDDVADDLVPIAKETFQRSDGREQTLRCELMLLGAHPNEDIGIPGYARCTVHTFGSPDFVPVPNVGKVVSIGSGSGVAKYKEMLERLSSPENVLLFMKGEMMGARMGFLPLSMIMQKTVEKYPTPGISLHTHICVVRRGSLDVGTNDENEYSPGGEKIEFRMPPVASTWDGFEQLASADSQSPHCASC